MYSVMLLDDEPWELKSLLRIFPWHEYGFEILYALDDSLEAQKILLNNKIDVLISDIRMPGLDGIELLSSLRRNNVSTEIIFLTGHAEFEYAQKALKLGAYDYFLKPVDLDITSNVLEGLKDHLNQKHLIDDLILMDQITTHKTSMAAIFHTTEQYRYAAIISNTDLTGYLNIPELDLHIIKLTPAQERYLYLFQFPMTFSFPADISPIPHDLHCGISEFTDAPMTPAHLLIKQAEAAYHTTFITGKEGLYCFHDINLNELQIIIDKTKLLLDQNSYSQLTGLFHELPEYFFKNSITVTGVIKFWNELLVYVVKDSDTLSEYHLSDINDLLERFQTFTELLHYLLEVIQTEMHHTFHITSKAKQSESEEIYTDMVKYIEENYRKPVTLQNIADAIHVSFAYASKVFHKHAGITYSKYLTNRRIQAACYLLQSTGLPIRDICFFIGYDDYYYFNNVFKKEMKLTPNQYRKASKLV